MDAGPDLELKLIRDDYGHRWEAYYLERGADVPVAWLAYDRERPMFPAVTADSAGELRDRLALLTPHPRPL